MPRFFFDVDAEGLDTDGLELPDRKSARAEAIRAAGEILRDIDGALFSEDWVMIVKGERGETVWELRFSVVEKGDS